LVGRHCILTKILAAHVGLGSGLSSEHLCGVHLLLCLLEFVVRLLVLAVEFLLAILELCQLLADPCRFGLLVGKRIRARWPNHDGSDNQSGYRT
jgi:hypothetical protein